MRAYEFVRHLCVCLGLPAVLLALPGCRPTPTASEANRKGPGGTKRTVTICPVEFHGSHLSEAAREDLTLTLYSGLVLRFARLGNGRFAVRSTFRGKQDACQAPCVALANEFVKTRVDLVTSTSEHARSAAQQRIQVETQWFVGDKATARGVAMAEADGLAIHEAVSKAIEASVDDLMQKVNRRHPEPLRRPAAPFRHQTLGTTPALKLPGR